MRITRPVLSFLCVCLPSSSRFCVLCSQYQSLRRLSLPSNSVDLSMSSLLVFTHFSVRSPLFFFLPPFSPAYISSRFLSYYSSSLVSSPMTLYLIKFQRMFFFLQFPSSSPPTILSYPPPTPPPPRVSLSVYNIIGESRHLFGGKLKLCLYQRKDDLYSKSLLPRYVGSWSTLA